MKSNTTTKNSPDQDKTTEVVPSIYKKEETSQQPTNVKEELYAIGKRLGWYGHY